MNLLFWLRAFSCCMKRLSVTGVLRMCLWIRQFQDFLNYCFQLHYNLMIEKKITLKHFEQYIPKIIRIVLKGMKWDRHFISCTTIFSYSLAFWAHDEQLVQWLAQSFPFLPLQTDCFFSKLSPPLFLLPTYGSTLPLLIPLTQHPHQSMKTLLPIPVLHHSEVYHHLLYLNLYCISPLCSLTHSLSLSFCNTLFQILLTTSCSLPLLSTTSAVSPANCKWLTSHFLWLISIHYSCPLLYITIQKLIQSGWKKSKHSKPHCGRNEINSWFFFLFKSRVETKVTSLALLHTHSWAERRCCRFWWCLPAAGLMSGWLNRSLQGQEVVVFSQVLSVLCGSR